MPSPASGGHSPCSVGHTTHVEDASTWAPIQLKKDRVSQLDLKGFTANSFDAYSLSV